MKRRAKEELEPQGSRMMRRKLLNELKLTLKSHEELNPKLWNEDGKLDLKCGVLDRIGKEWAQFAKIPKVRSRMLP